VRWVGGCVRGKRCFGRKKGLSVHPPLPRHKHTSNLPRTFYLCELVAKVFDEFGFENNFAFAFAFPILSRLSVNYLLVIVFSVLNCRFKSFCFSCLVKTKLFVKWCQFVMFIIDLILFLCFLYLTSNYLAGFLFLELQLTCRTNLLLDFCDQNITFSYLRKDIQTPLTYFCIARKKVEKEKRTYKAKKSYKQTKTIKHTMSETGKRKTEMFQ
jgi:hypothetical protein